MTPTPKLTPAQQLSFQHECEFHARRSGFIVRAALMFNVPCSEVTQAQYMAAVRHTEDCTMPRERS